MKRLALYVLASLVAFSSCTKNDIAPGDIDIEFQFETLPVDLNVVDNPFITCVIRSESGLESVRMMIEMEDGTLVPYKTDITEFFNPRHCSIYERPVYTEGMSAFIVQATDLGGAVKEGRVPFEVTSKVNAPVIAFTTDGISFTEGDPIPEFGFTVSANASLSSVSVELIQSAVSSELVPMIEDFEDPRNFEFLSSAFDLADYDIYKIPQFVRVIVTDSYGKKSISTLKINYKSLPAPVLNMDQVSSATEFEDLSLTGKATSGTGIVKVECYAVGDGYEALAASVDVGHSEECEISVKVPGDDIRDYITSIKVVAIDARTKRTAVIIPVTVTPVYETVDAACDLVEEIGSRFEDDKCRTVKLLLPEGARYTISSELPLTKNLKLKGASSQNMPAITVSSAYTFTTGSADLDVISFEKVRFETTKSSASFIGNNSTAGSIGELSVRDCVFEKYAHAFYRDVVDARIDTILIEDSRFFWANTASTTFSFLHFGKEESTLSHALIRNCTFTGVLYMHYNNNSNTVTELEISNCTFANSKAGDGSYFIMYKKSTIKGTVRLKKNLFGGSNNLTGNCRMLRAYNMTTELSDNYCTKGWKTFKDDSTNNSMNFCTMLPDTEDNYDIFKDFENNDFTLLPRTTVYNYGIGDTNWIK